MGNVTAPPAEIATEPARIQLMRETAAGPVSAVFAGLDAQGRRVAVKLLRESPDGGGDHLFDLRDRARKVGGLDHRHHACVHDVAMVDERFALVSPYVDGIDLLDWADVLAETGKMVPRRVSCEILRCVAVAVEAGSSGMPGRSDGPGLWHRDLKPSNVLISRDGEVKVTDFSSGYTSIAGRAARSGVLKKGLVRYLSPERREGRRSQGEADVYALGILALELFRGKWLRRLHSQNPAHDRHLADVVARIEDLQMRSDSDDRALRNILLRMVAFDPEARPAIQEVASAFRGFTDRAAGPSLETFAHDHAVPWLEDPPEVPDASLEGVSAQVLERGAPLPEPSGGTVSVVTLPDRYDLQLAGSSGETGEFAVGELTGPEEPPPELTDPRLRKVIEGETAALDPDEDFEEGHEEDEHEVPDGPPPESELWGPPEATAEVLAEAGRVARQTEASTPAVPLQRTPLPRPGEATVDADQAGALPVGATPDVPDEPAATHDGAVTEVVLDDLDLLGDVDTSLEEAPDDAVPPPAPSETPAAPETTAPPSNPPSPAAASLTEAPTGEPDGTHEPIEAPSTPVAEPEPPDSEDDEDDLGALLESVAVTPEATWEDDDFDLTPDLPTEDAPRPTPPAPTPERREVTVEPVPAPPAVEVELEADVDETDDASPSASTVSWLLVALLVAAVLGILVAVITVAIVVVLMLG